jgi:hypothetical protein
MHILQEKSVIISDFSSTATPIASLIYSGVSSKFKLLNSSHTSDINPSNIYFIDGSLFPF